jgi:HSP20 family protein
MLFRFDEFDGAFRRLDDLHRRRREAGWSARREPALSETEDALTLRLELPGVRPEDVDISVEDGTLTLSAQRQVEAPEGYTAHLQERRPLRLRRSFSLPRQVDPELIAARLAEGVLTLRMQKAEVPGPRQITVVAG